MSQGTNRDLITVAQAAAEFGVTRVRIYQLLVAERLNRYYLSGSTKTHVKRQELHRIWKGHRMKKKIQQLALPFPDSKFKKDEGD